eukprot:gene19366-biopygen5495
MAAGQRWRNRAPGDPGDPPPGTLLRGPSSGDPPPGTLRGPGDAGQAPKAPAAVGRLRGAVA